MPGGKMFEIPDGSHGKLVLLLWRQGLDFVQLVKEGFAVVATEVLVDGHLVPADLGRNLRDGEGDGPQLSYQLQGSVVRRGTASFVPLFLREQGTLACCHGWEVDTAPHEMDFRHRVSRGHQDR